MAKYLVAAGVIEVPVGVEQKADTPVAQPADGCFQFGGLGGYVAVDEGHSVRFYDYRNVAAGAGDQVQTGG